MNFKVTLLLITLVACVSACGKATSDVSTPSSLPAQIEVSTQTDSIPETETVPKTEVTPETKSAIDYSIFTDIPTDEVISFAQDIQTSIANDDWASLSKVVSYPITIGTVVFKSESDFASYDFTTLFDDSFKKAVADTDCTQLFANYNGAMFGNGELWIAEVLDDELHSEGLKIIGVNLGE